MTPDEKATFLDIMLKCVVPYVQDTETGFRITFLSNDDGAEAIRKLNSDFAWVKANQYSLLALLNFIQTLTNQSTTSRDRKKSFGSSLALLHFSAGSKINQSPSKHQPDVIRIEK